MARQFQFRLQVVLKLRQQARDEQRRVVAEHVRGVDAARRRIDSLVDDLAATKGESRGVQLTGDLDVRTLRQHQLHRSWLERSIAGARGEWERRRADLGAQQAMLSELSKRVRVIEKLRERQWERFRFEMAREEQLTNDEAALQLFERRARLMENETTGDAW